jgi:hypothetical protein
MGHLQNFAEPERMSALRPNADIKVTHRHVSGLCKLDLRQTTQLEAA